MKRSRRIIVNKGSEIKALLKWTSLRSGQWRKKCRRRIVTYFNLLDLFRSVKVFFFIVLKFGKGSIVY